MLYDRADNILKTMISFQCSHTPSSSFLSAPSRLRGGLPGFSQVQQFPSGGTQLVHEGWEKHTHSLVPLFYIPVRSSLSTALSSKYSTAILDKPCGLGGSSCHILPSHSIQQGWKHSSFISNSHLQQGQSWNTLSGFCSQKLSTLKGLASHQEPTFSILSFINIVYSAKAIGRR